MTRWATITSALLVSAFAVAGQRSRARSGWVSLFDGKSLDSFTQTGEANWRIEDGAIVADKGKGGHLVSKEKYKDHAIRIEFWSDEKANSGIFARCEPDKIGARTCYEFNIFDHAPRSELRHRLDRLHRRGQSDAEGGRQVEHDGGHMKGRQLTLVFNGVKTVDVRNGLWEEGHFTLQYGTGVAEIPQGRGQEALIGHENAVIPAGRSPAAGMAALPFGAAARASSRALIHASTRASGPRRNGTSSAISARAQRDHPEAENRQEADKARRDQHHRQRDAHHGRAAAADPAQPPCAPGRQVRLQAVAALD